MKLIAKDSKIMKVSMVTFTDRQHTKPCDLQSTDIRSKETFMGARFCCHEVSGSLLSSIEISFTSECKGALILLMHSMAPSCSQMHVAINVRKVASTVK